MNDIEQLTEVRGIGRSKAEELLEQFGSFEEITDSSVPRLTRVDDVGTTTAERLLDVSDEGTQKSGSSSDSRESATPNHSQSTGNTDERVQDLLDSMRTTESIEELGTLAKRAKQLARDNNTVAIRNPTFIETLTQIYQREEELFTKDEYDRVYVLRYSAWAIAECVEHRPEPILDRLETPLKLIRDTSISKNIRISAAQILTNLIYEHPDLLIEELEDHHGKVREAVRFRHPEQESDNAATTAASLIDFYTDRRETSPYQDAASSLIELIDNDTAYRALERIAEEAPLSVIDQATTIDRMLSEAESYFATRLTDVLATAANAASEGAFPLFDAIDLRPEYPPTIRQKIVDVYASAAAEASDPVDMPLSTLEELISDDDWQVREQAVQLVAAADLDETTRTELLERLASDPMPEVAQVAAEAQK